MIRLTGTKTGYAALAATVLMSGLLGGCTDDNAASPEPSGSPSSSAASPTGSESPTVQPATGPLLEQDHATMNAPTGFKPMPKLVDFRTSTQSKEGLDAVSMGEGPWGDDPLDLAARIALRNSRYLQPPHRVDDVEIDGVPAYHLVGGLDSHTAGDLYGAVRDGVSIDIEFALSKDRPAAQRRRMIEASLATFHWK